MQIVLFSEYIKKDERVEMYGHKSQKNKNKLIANKIVLGVKRVNSNNLVETEQGEGNKSKK